jgi:hypothetical protein
MCTRHFLKNKLEKLSGIEKGHLFGIDTIGEKEQFEGLDSIAIGESETVQFEE